MWNVSSYFFYQIWPSDEIFSESRSRWFGIGTFYFGLDKKSRNPGDRDQDMKTSKTSRVQNPENPGDRDLDLKIPRNRFFFRKMGYPDKKPTLIFYAQTNINYWSFSSPTQILPNEKENIRLGSLPAKNLSVNTNFLITLLISTTKSWMNLL